MQRQQLAIGCLATIFGVVVMGVVPFAGPQPAKRCAPESPVVNIPLDDRQANYDNGSCAWAATISLLRWQERPDLADAVRRTRSGGVPVPGVLRTIATTGLQFAGTADGDEGFLEECCRARRGAVVVVPGSRSGSVLHAVNIVDIDEFRVCLLDNNSIRNYIWVPRAVFMEAWHATGGIAFTPLYDPAAPLP